MIAVAVRRMGIPRVIMHGHRTCAALRTARRNGHSGPARSLGLRGALVTQGLRAA
jgi:hypothetical protein